MFENKLESGLFSSVSEKTFIDKILARQDVDRIREIIKKPYLKREELLEILYLLVSTESKLLNFDEWGRYVILKFFVWIREFIKVAELIYDYQDDLKIKSTTCALCNKVIEKKCICVNPKPILAITPRSNKLLNNNIRLIEHNAKFLIDLYFNIGRTTLSLGATGFIEMLKNKYEVSYPYGNPAIPTIPQQEKKGFSLFKTK